MAADHLFLCDVLGLIVAQLNRLDAAMLSMTCTQAAAQVRAQQLSPASPRICISSSGNYRLLLLPLTPDGRAYVGHQQRDTVSSRTRNRLHGAPCQLDAVCVFEKCRPLQWLTGIAACPYDHCLYVAAYGTHTDSNDTSTSLAAPSDTQPSTHAPGRASADAPSQILRFSTGTLRPCGQLVSGPAIQDPEGLAFAKHACYVASAGHSSLLCVGLPDGSIRQSLALAGSGVPWGMAAWDPSTYPQHAFAAQQAARVQQHQPREPQGDTCLRDMCSGQGQCAADRSTKATADAADGVHLDDMAFDAAAAASCLLVAVQVDFSKKQYWLPPAGPASGVLLCVPLSPDGTMMSVREWSRVKIKRPSGVSIDHAGHVWTTSLEQQLLRFSGPSYPSSGCLLQRVDLVQLLPAQAGCLYPMDCQAIVQQAQAAGLQAISGSLVQGAAAIGSNCGQRCAALSCLLIVTLHAGPKLPGAVAVIKVENGPAGQHAQGCGPAGQEGTRIRLVSFWQDRLLQQPNMIAAF